LASGRLSENSVTDFNHVIYPNPASGFIHYDITSKEVDQIKIVLTDVGGREVLSFTRELTEGDNSLMLDITGVAAGYYYIRTMKKDQIWIDKLVVQ
jgi:hypothetical protein